MKKHGGLRDLASLPLILAITIFTLLTPVSSSDDLVLYNPINLDQITTMPGGMKICPMENYFNSRVKSLFLGDTAFISVNENVTLMFESTCFKKNYSIMINSKIWYNKMYSSFSLVLEYTIDGLVIKSENEIEYSEKDLMLMNSEIKKGIDCSYRDYSLNITILEEDINDRFVDKCDFESMYENVDLCYIHSVNYKRSSLSKQYWRTSDTFVNDTLLKDKIVIKFESNAVIIKTMYCDKQIHITQFNSNDFVNDLNEIDKWFRFEYNVEKLIFNSSISISISGIQVDSWNYKDPKCYEEPKFVFIGVNDIKRICFNYEKQLIKVSEPVYTTNYYEGRVINFPYLIIIIMIILGKAICGYGVYKRRQARLISFTTRRIVNNFEDVSRVGSNVITIVSSNQQSVFQSLSQRQPSEDLPPAYNDLQNTDSNPPGYEDACKNKSFSPPGYEDACRDNIGFQTDIETSTSSNAPESMVVNQVSTNNTAATQR